MNRLEKYTEEIRAYDNSNLFEELLYVTIPDDYDGAFTPEGQEDLVVVEAEVRLRLKDWLTE